MVDVNNNTVTPYKEITNALIPQRFSEYLTVVPHCNGTDYWIITKGYSLVYDNNFYSFLVNSNGIDATQTPVVTSGISQPSYGGGGYQLKANRSGTRLLIT